MEMKLAIALCVDVHIITVLVSVSSDPQLDRQMPSNKRVEM